MPEIVCPTNLPQRPAAPPAPRPPSPQRSPAWSHHETGSPLPQSYRGSSGQRSAQGTVASITSRLPPTSPPGWRSSRRGRSARRPRIVQDRNDKKRRAPGTPRNPRMLPARPPRNYPTSPGRGRSGPGAVLPAATAALSCRFFRHAVARFHESCRTTGREVRPQKEVAEAFNSRRRTSKRVHCCGSCHT